MSHITIDRDRCKACYLCIKECPKQLIKISELTNSSGNKTVEFVDESGECIGCCMCAQRCPDLAITEVYKG